jgi:hypothetical protein
MRQTLQLLNYLAMQDDAVLSYHASDMVLSVHSDASYLSEPKAPYFYQVTPSLPPDNGVVLNIAHILKNVMPSTTEATLLGLYNDA